MPPQQPQPQQQGQPQPPSPTIVITNFGGRLSRVQNGDLNSGFAKFSTSWGYDPFSSPMNLTWLETPTSIAGTSDIILASKNRFEGGSPFMYAIGSQGKAYQVRLDNSSVIGAGSVLSGGQSYNYGASIEFYGTPGKMYVGGDKGVSALPISSVSTGEFGGDAIVGSTANYVQNSPRPLVRFNGELLFGNGPTIGAIDSTNLVTSSVIGVGIGTQGATQNIYSAVSPPLPSELTVKDVDVSPDYNYMLMTATEAGKEDLITVTSDRVVIGNYNSTIARWNGSDLGVTAGVQLPGVSTTALQTFLQKNLTFSSDVFGMSLLNEGQKLLTLPGNKPPTANATGVNGNFVYWTSPEVVNASIVGSLYYYGSLDQENPTGLYRLMRFNTTIPAGYVYQIPWVTLVTNNYNGVNNAITSIASFGLGKHYFSTFEVNNSTNSVAGSNAKLMSFLVTPNGTGTPQPGVYETQTQLFSKRVGLAQIRVYTTPTKAGNGFKLDLIGSDGNVIPNGTFTYSFGDITDPQSGSTSVERVNFNSNVRNLYALGVRLTNTGTTNMKILKVEIDKSPEGK